MITYFDVVCVTGSASGSSSLNNSTNSSNNLLEGLDSSESGSESDLDLQNLASIRGPLRFVYPRRHSPRRLRWGPLDQRRLGGSPHASRFVFVIFLKKIPRGSILFVIVI